MNSIKEENYPFLVHDVMLYIEKVKQSENDDNLLDIIMDYCDKHNVSEETVGDAISSDVYFKSFIEKDCEMHKIFRTEKDSLDEW